MYFVKTIKNILYSKKNRVLKKVFPPAPFLACSVLAPYLCDAFNTSLVTLCVASLAAREREKRTKKESAF